MNRNKGNALFLIVDIPFYAFKLKKKKKKNPFE